MFLDMQSALEYMYSSPKPKGNIENVKKLYEKYQNFHHNLPCVHIAGTNGKGSTTNYLRSILQNSNYKVGTYTSPFLIVHNDRIRINDVNISDEDYVRILNEFYLDFESEERTMFEKDLFIALRYFYEQKVDIAIVEVGVGGRLDPSNVVSPLVSVICNVGFDHMEYLGDSLASIGYEKAGIIKEGKHVVLGSYFDDSVKEIINQEVTLKNAKAKYINEPSNIKVNGNVTSFTYDDNVYQIKGSTLYQPLNASLALETSLILKDLGYTKINLDTIKKGLSSCFWLGRFEKMSDKPLIFIDGAHNLHGVNALCKTLEEYKKSYKIKILFSVVKDKQSDLMIEKLIDVSEEVHVSEFDFYRAKKASEIAKGHQVIVNQDWRKAIDELINKYQEDEMIVITGSLYFISQVREYLLRLGEICV